LAALADVPRTDRGARAGAGRAEHAARVVNCPSCQNDTLTHHSRSEGGRRWVTTRCSACGYVDSSPSGPEAPQWRGAPGFPGPPDKLPLACPRCSKSIRPGGGMRLTTGEAIHVRCLAWDSRKRPVGLQGEGQAVGEEAAAGAQRSPLTDQAARLRACAVGRRSLKTGGGLLFQGDRLVHALCWDASQGSSADKDSTPR